MLCLLCLAALQAQTWLPYNPKLERRTVSPLIDTPLRDTFINRAPDGRWYLTGTLAAANDPRDFTRNDGVQVWASSDLRTWTSLGLVWRRPTGNAVLAPEIHFIKGTCYIPYSIDGHGTGLLKADKAEGPFVDLGRITRQGGGDPSLFVDDDGTVYWLWGQGWIAPMRPDLGGLAGTPVQLTTRILNQGAQGLLVGLWQRSHLRGFGLHKIRGRYHLTFDTWSTRLAGPVNDAMTCSAAQVLGPYDYPVPMVNHSGQTCLVPIGDDAWAATVSGPDGWSAFRDRPGLVRLAWFEQNKTWIRVRGNDFTEMGAFEKNQPIQVKMGADPEMLQAPDGFYYFIASAIKPGKLLMYRSKTLDPSTPWEEIEVSNGQAIVDEARWPVEKLGDGQKAEDPAKVNIWEGSHMWYRNRLYIGAGLLSLAAPGGRKTGIGLWRSREGTGAPPYEFVNRIANNDGFSFFNDDEKAAYICYGFGGLRRFTDDMSGLDPAFKQVDLHWRDRSQINYDCGYHLVKIGSTYIKQTINNFGSYSSAYGTADRIEGPYDFQGVCMPHGGNSPLFKDLAGDWWMYGWGNTDIFLPYWDGTPVWMEPMTVEQRDGRLVIEPRYRTKGWK